MPDICSPWQLGHGQMTPDVIIANDKQLGPCEPLRSEVTAGGPVMHSAVAGPEQLRWGPYKIGSGFCF